VSATVGAGRFVAWDGGCLFIGRHHTPVPVHAHQAIQLVMGRDARHFVRAGEQAPWIEYSAAVIPSHQPHGIDVTRADYGIVVFVEPETREGRAIAERHIRGGVSEVGSASLETAAHHLFDTWLRQENEQAIAAAARSLVSLLSEGIEPTINHHLFDTWLRQENEQAIAAAARSLVSLLSEGIEPTIITDERILRAIAYIGANLASPLTLDEVASHVFLSPSRFRHLFAEQTGMGLRPYVLWRRFLHIWNLVMRGVSLSTAAHSAGFADAAHLTRTSKRMFGFAPSAMQLVAGTPPGASSGSDSGVSARTLPPRAGSRTHTARRGTRKS